MPEVQEPQLGPTKEGSVLRMARTRRPRSRDSEVHAYAWIKKNLETLGWDIRNPERAAGGQVWTQNEVTHNAELKKFLVLDKPENIVKVTDRAIWIIEAKRSHVQLPQAVGEAEAYATALRPSKRVLPLFVSGVAGNDIDSYLVRTEFWDGTRYVPVTLNGTPATGLLAPAHVAQIMQTGAAEISDPQIDERLFLARAERINAILHLGAVNPHQRAGVMAALLLAMGSSTPPNIEERDPSTLISDINGRAQSILVQQGKGNFFEYVRINLPSTPDNHVKLRQALVNTIQELNNLNIRSAMNSGSDWLGAFYEVFLKYANWAQDLGIVLTPRHITRFVADVMDVQTNDIVYDPTCGTGGFLVAAFDYVKQRGGPQQVARFKQYSVFGIEQDAGVAALAVVNMIFRGDGKNNIQEGNCFSKTLTSHVEKGVPTARYGTGPNQDPAVTKVMMNPPFALKAGEEKEFKFVDKALEQMEHGGLLFSILPYAAMVKPGAYLTWRRDSLLPNNTLVAAVTFPVDLFYPVAVASVGIFVRKGLPHPPGQNVLWVRAVNDGLLKRKGRRLPSPRATNDLNRTHDVLKAFLTNPQYAVTNVEREQKACPIDPLDTMYELVPENYLDQPLPSREELQDGMEQILRNSVAFMIRARKENAPPVQ
jgi:type I restriction-modification system DNA methylase subunit